MKKTQTADKVIKVKFILGIIYYSDDAIYTGRGNLQMGSSRMYTMQILVLNDITHIVIEINHLCTMHVFFRKYTNMYSINCALNHVLFIIKVPIPVL